MFLISLEVIVFFETFINIFVFAFSENLERKLVAVIEA